MKEGAKEGWKEGTKEQRKEGRKEQRKEGTKEVSNEGRKKRIEGTCYQDERCIRMVLRESQAD